MPTQHDVGVDLAQTHGNLPWSCKPHGAMRYGLEKKLAIARRRAMAEQDLRREPVVVRQGTEPCQLVGAEGGA